MKRTKEVELHKTQDIAAGTLTFISDASEEFSVCFTSVCKAVSFGEVEIMIDIRTGIDANDYSNLAKQEHLDGLEVELKKLGDCMEPPVLPHSLVRITFASLVRFTFPTPKFCSYFLDTAQNKI